MSGRPLTLGPTVALGPDLQTLPADATRLAVDVTRAAAAPVATIGPLLGATTIPRLSLDDVEMRMAYGAGVVSPPVRALALGIDDL